jgi:ABC-type nickel/cobalt efflux system permease component RcnA
MLEILILTILTVASSFILGMLHGFKQGYGEGKRAGYFRAYADRVNQ